MIKLHKNDHCQQEVAFKVVKAVTKLDGNNWQRNEGIHQVVHL